jgi:glycosyltransferase involved in cell wall biosynthesis
MILENAKISVVVPIYNAEKYIRRCVDSILAQSYTNLEVLLMDDGSKDGTPAILDEYEAKDKRVKAIHKANTGHASSRNMGLLQATGEFITFMDCDDYMYPDFMEKMYGAICEDSSDMACCSFRYVDVDGNELSWATPKLSRTCVGPMEAQREFLTTYNIEGFSWNKLVRRSILMDHELRYVEDQKAFVDMFLWYRSLSFSKKVSYVPDKLYDYYQMPGSVVHSIDDEKIGNFIRTISNIRAQAEKNGLAEDGRYYAAVRMFNKVYDQIKNDVKGRFKTGFFRKYSYDELYEVSRKELAGFIKRDDRISARKRIFGSVMSAFYLK